MKNLIYLTILLLITNTAQSQSFQWSKRGGSIDQLSINSGSRQEEVYSIVTDSNKNVYVLSAVGQIDLNVDGHPKTNFGDSTTKTDFMLASFACDGSYRWSKVLGGGGNEIIKNLQIDAQDNIYVAGTFGTYASPLDPYNPRIDNDVVYPQIFNTSITFLTKFNTAGVMQWFKKVQDSTTEYNLAYNYGLSVDAAGNSYWLLKLHPGSFANGAFVNTLAGENFYLFKYNSAGIFINASLVDMQLGGDFIYYLKMQRNPYTGNYYFTSSGGYPDDTAVLGGQTVTHSMFMACYNPQGQFLWKKENSSTTGSHCWIYNLAFDSSNNIYLGGKVAGFGTDTFLGLSDSDLFSGGFVMKLDPTADTVLWSSQHNKGTGDNGAIALNGNELGFTSYSFGVDLTWGSQSLYMCASNEASEVLFARFNKDTGACLSLTKIPGDVGYDDGGTALAVDASGDYILGGGFGHQLMVNNTTTLLNNGPQSDFFVAKYATEACSPLANEEFHLAKESRLTVAPNPTNSSTVVYYNGGNSSSSLVLVDMLGRTLQTFSLNTPKGALTIDCSHYAVGQYLLLFKENNTIIENTKLLINK